MRIGAHHSGTSLIKSVSLLHGRLGHQMDCHVGCVPFPIGRLYRHRNSPPCDNCLTNSLLDIEFINQDLPKYGSKFTPTTKVTVRTHSAHSVCDRVLLTFMLENSVFKLLKVLTMDVACSSVWFLLVGIFRRGAGLVEELSFRVSDDEVAGVRGCDKSVKNVLSRS
jgi:hypothetical protein